MDNDPKSYRVPILHLSDVLKDEEKPSTEVPTQPVVLAPAQPVPVAPVQPVIVQSQPAPSVQNVVYVAPQTLADEAKMLQEQFIVQAEKEIKNRPLSLTPKKQAPAKTFDSDENDSVQNVPIHVEEHTHQHASPKKIPKKKQSARISEDEEDIIDEAPENEEEETTYQAPEELVYEEEDEAEGEVEDEEDVIDEASEEIEPEKELIRTHEEISDILGPYVPDGEQLEDESTHEKSILDRIFGKNETTTYEKDGTVESEVPVPQAVENTEDEKNKSDTPVANEPKDIWETQENETAEPETQKDNGPTPISLYDAPPDPLDIWEKAAKSSKNTSSTNFSKEDLSEKHTRQEWTSSKVPTPEKSPVLVSMSEIKPQPTHVEPMEEKIVPVVPQVSNLSALREQVIKDNEEKVSVEETKASETVPLSPLSPLPEPQFTNPADPLDLDTEHTTLRASINEKIEAIQAEKSADSASGERARPDTKHAQVLSNVADRLRNMSAREPTATTEDTAGFTDIKINTETSGSLHDEKIPQTEVPLENPIPEIKPLAPGEIREPEPVNTSGSSIPLIRTFRQDVELAVTKNRTSVVDMISAEEKRRVSDERVRRAPEQKMSTLSYIFIGASAILLLGAIAIGAFFFYRFILSDTTPPTPELVPTINKTTYNITNQSRDDLMQGISDERDSIRVSPDSFTNVKLMIDTIDETTQAVSTTMVKPSGFLDILAPNMPDTLLRSVTNDMVLGVHENGTNEVFLAFKVNDTAITLRGMFDWEENMDIDLAPLFGQALQRETIVTPSVSPSATTSSSTEPIEERKVSTNIIYTDLFVANVEARGLKDSQGMYTLLWAMPDPYTVVITTNENTLRRVIESMTNMSV